MKLTISHDNRIKLEAENQDDRSFLTQFCSTKHYRDNETVGILSETYSAGDSQTLRCTIGWQQKSSPLSIKQFLKDLFKK